MISLQQLASLCTAWWKQITWGVDLLRNGFIFKAVGKDPITKEFSLLVGSLEWACGGVDNFAEGLLPTVVLPAFSPSPLPQDPGFCGFIRAKEGPHHLQLHKGPFQAQRPAMSGGPGGQGRLTWRLRIVGCCGETALKEGRSSVRVVWPEVAT